MHYTHHTVSVDRQLVLAPWMSQMFYIYNAGEVWGPTPGEAEKEGRLGITLSSSGNLDMCVLHLSAIQMAGAAVKKATETLVKAAQQASVDVEESKPFGPKVKGSVMKGFREELQRSWGSLRRQRSSCTRFVVKDIIRWKLTFVLTCRYSL